MATTDIGVNHPLAVKVWSKKLSLEVPGATYFNKFAASSSDALFQVKDELTKGAGDKVTHGLRMLATGSGIQGDNTAEGNEEALTLYNDSLFIDQLREPFRTGGKMTEQRIPFNLRNELYEAAKDWWVERLDVSVFNQLTGYTAQTDTRFTGNNATVAPSSGRVVFGGGEATEASLSATTTHAIKLSDLDKAVAIAKVQSPRLRPVNVSGKKLLVGFFHPYAIRQMRADASTAGNFFDVQKAILQGGKISDNPIITGAEFIYNGVVVHESSYLPTTVTASVNASFRRGVVCGAQAVCCAYGANNGPSKMTWVEELFDYENQFGVSAGMVFGMKKSVYNSVDFGVITMAGYAPAP